LLDIWIDKKSRQELREELGDQDIYPSAFKHYFELPDTDDVDVLAKIGFELTQVPTRRDRVARFWDQDMQWYESKFGMYLPKPADSDLVIGNTDFSLAAEGAEETGEKWKIDFWRTALDHYSLFGIDDLEQARTYAASQSVDEFGSFQSLSTRYVAPRLKSDLEEVKQHLYIPMTNG